MNPTILWPDESLPVEIYCAPGVLTGLETMATDGLLAMPRTGLGIGGLLLGRRGNRRIDILKTRAIPCSHAMGPAFVLTPEEIEASLTLPADDGELENEAEPDAGYEVVGWYCSRPNGQLALTENGQALFDALCPEPWQAAFLIRPSLGRATIAVFGFRSHGQSGNSALLGVPRELVWQDLTALTASGQETVQPETGQPEAGQPETGRLESSQPIPQTAAAPTSPGPALASPPVRVEAPAQAAAASRPVIPVPLPRGGTLFDTADRRGSGSKKVWLWPMWVAGAVFLLVLLSALAFFARH